MIHLQILKLRNDHEKQLNRKLQRNTTFDKNRDLGEVFKERLVKNVFSN